MTNHLHQRQLYAHAAVILVSTLSLAGCKDKSAAPVEERPRLVETETIAVETFEVRQPVVGILEPNRSSTVSFEVSGTVEAVHVELGDKVTAKEPLIDLKTDIFDALLRQATVDELRAQQDYDRLTKLRSGGASSEEEFDRAQTSLYMAKAKKLEAGLRKERAALTSPYPAQVSKVHIEKGETVSPGDPAVDLVEVNPLKLAVSVPEADIARIQPGQKARLKLNCPHEPVKTAEITRVAPDVTGRTPLYTVEIDVDNGQGNLRAGMIATGYVVTARQPDVWAIPLASLIVRGDVTGCMVQQGGKARLLSLPENIERNRGYALVPREHWVGQLGDQTNELALIVRGHKALRDGSRVQIYDPEADQQQGPRLKFDQENEIEAAPGKIEAAVSVPTASR